MIQIICLPLNLTELDRPTNEVSWLLLPLNAPDPLKPRLASFSFIRPNCKEGILDFGWISMKATVLEFRFTKYFIRIKFISA